MSNKRIFIIEDDEDIARNLTELLETEGYAVELARNGKLALEKLRAGTFAPPSLIILDLMMPVMDGYEFRRNQELDPALSAIPVAIMTADGNIEAKQQRVRAQAFIRKPLDIDTVLELAERYCA